MDKPESTLVGGLLDAYAITPALALDLYDELAQIEVISTARVSQLSRLLGYLLSPLLPEERATLLLTREKLSQQSHINETIQMYKEQAPSKARNYFYEKEAVLLTKVKTGNMPQVKALLNDFLGYVFFHEGGKLEAVRMRALELTTLLSRVAMEGGARENVAYDLNASFSSLMNKEQSLDSICYLLQDAVEGFMQAMFSPSGGASAHIRRALGYVAANYPQPLTLDSTAREIGLSPSYLSALFKKATGMRFREHLNRVRVEEGKLLLLSTNDSLADIALALGFGDQSYFCKVFKRVVGLTPGQFRG